MKEKSSIKPLITVITVVFNNPDGLEKTIKSVVNQSFKRFEYIIIDGGSKKPTLDVIKKYEKHIDFWISEKDNGIFDAMNKGIDLANGEWVNFMNADDIFVNKDVLKEISVYFNKKYATVYGNTLIGKRILKPWPINRLTLSMKSPTCHQSTFFQTNILRKYKFDLVNNIGGDPEQLVRLYLDKHNFKYVDMSVANYVLGGFSSKNIARGLKNKIIYIHKHFGLFWVMFTLIVGVKRLIFAWFSRLIKK